MDCTEGCVNEMMLLCAVGILGSAFRSLVFRREGRMRLLTTLSGCLVFINKPKRRNLVVGPKLSSGRRAESLLIF
jgi:hypothetical protein